MLFKSFYSKFNIFGFPKFFVMYTPMYNQSSNEYTINIVQRSCYTLPSILFYVSTYQ